MRFKPKRSVYVTCVLTLLIQLPADFAIAQEADIEMSPASDTTDPPVQLDGFWPTQAMTRGLLLRWADDMADSFELDDEQQQAIETQLLERWPAYLNENREDIQPLINEFIEARLQTEPPDADFVKNWADRAIPAFELFEEQVLDTFRDAESVLDPRQKAALANESLKASAGLHVFGAKLRGWQTGEYNEREWWDPPASVRKQRRQERRAVAEAQALANAPSAAKERIDRELKLWDEFFDEFVQRFDLDPSQLESAKSILRECRQRANDHFVRFRSRMEVLEKRLADDNADSDEINRELKEMYGPIDTLFAELKARLDPIPTSAQRAAVKREGNPNQSAPGANGHQTSANAHETSDNEAPLVLSDESQPDDNTTPPKPKPDDKG
jgi:hypothetical protein